MEKWSKGRALLGTSWLGGSFREIFRSFLQLEEHQFSCVASSTSTSFLLAYSSTKPELSAHQNVFYILNQLPLPIPRKVVIIIVLFSQARAGPALGLHSSPLTLFCGKLDASASNKCHVLSVVCIACDISFPTSGLGLDLSSGPAFRWTLWK